MQSLIKSNSAKGFTLLELVLASAILSLFVGGITLSSFRSIAHATLSHEYSTLHALILEARARSLFGTSSYGVLVTDTDFILFPEVYKPDTEANKITPRTTGTVSGSTMIRFAHRSGDLLDADTATITIEKEGSAYTLTINRYGAIDTK